jgi:hypothetical protein
MSALVDRRRHLLADAIEREEILCWGRATGLLREVVQQYRFERRQGADTAVAHDAAAKLVAAADPRIVDPLRHAKVMIAWAESEHRAWFWRCCRDGHRL